MSQTIADKLVEIAENEVKLYESTFGKGYGQGYTKGYDDGLAVRKPEDLSDVLNEQEEKIATLSAILDKKASGGGMDADAFWNAYQDKGARVNYSYGFAGAGWTDETLKPKYNIKPTSASRMFSNCGATDIKGILERQGVVLDLSRLEKITYLADGASNKITRLPELNVTSVKSLDNFIYQLPDLKSIEKVILKSDGSQSFAVTSFGYLSALEEIRFEGVIGQSGINLQGSTKLSRNSIESIVYALSTTTSGLTITLSMDAVSGAYATREEWEAFANNRPNWTISLV